MQTKYLPENTNPQSTDWLLTENETASQKLSVGNLLALAGTPTDLEISDISGLQTALDNKADDFDTSVLSSAVAAKANQTTVDDLTMTVSGKIDKSLTEITTLSANDFLILETTTGTNRKAKVSLVRTSSSGITSETEPTNPANGLIWNEVDKNSYLLETWTMNSYRWVSGVKQYTGGSRGVTGNFQEYLPLNPGRDILIVSYSLLLYNTGSASYSGMASLSIDLGINITVTSFSTNGIAAGAKASYIYNLNTLYSPAKNNCLFLQVIKSGTGTGTVLSGYKIDYRDVRR